MCEKDKWSVSVPPSRDSAQFYAYYFFEREMWSVGRGVNSCLATSGSVDVFGSIKTPFDPCYFSCGINLEFNFN